MTSEPGRSASNLVQCVSFNRHMCDDWSIPGDFAIHFNRLCCPVYGVAARPATACGSKTPESIVTIRSPLCGYNLAQCVDLRDEDVIQVQFN